MGSESGPTTRSAATVLVVALVLLSVSTTGAVVGSPTAGSAGAADAAPHGSENGNYTVDIPKPEDHYPRSKNPDGTHHASVNHLSGLTPKLFEEAGTPKGTENASWIWITSQDIDFSECTSETTRAFGIDRDSDDPGTQTDIDLLSYQEGTIYKKHVIYVDFYEGDELAAPARQDKGGYGEGEGEGREDGDKNLEIYPDDQIISKQSDCYGMPEEPGWYQIQGYGNGTGFNGKFGETHLPSHYFYICECDSRQEAVETLGPPPSQQTETPSEDPSTETATPTATATTADKQGGSTPTATPDGGTATAGATPTDGASTTTGTATTEARTSSGTPTGGTSTGTSSSTGTATQAASTHATTSGGGGGPGGSGSSSGTPTSSGGPGFGLAVGFAALVAGALLAHRQQD